MPWLQLKGLDLESLHVLQAQADGMGKDWREFRQWWAVPFQSTAVQFGQPNRIDVSFAETNSVLTYRVFGEYGTPRLEHNDAYKIMPSPNTISWEKGFASYEAGDIRTSDTSVVLNGKVTDNSVSIVGQSHKKGDLSFDQGFQTGQFRIRLAIPASNNFAISLPPTSGNSLGETPQAAQSAGIDAETDLFVHKDALGVSANDPKTEKITSEPVPVPPVQKGVRYLLTCEAQSLSSARCGQLAVVFSGDKPTGEHMVWTSPFAPDVIPLTPAWRSFSFSDFLPDDFADMKNLKVEITAQPQDHARVLLHADSAAKQAIGLRRITLSLLPPMDIPPERDRDWVIF
jgi:hypothetical protein